MAASTASMCLRKESLSVHSQSNLQDSSRFNQYLLRLVQGMRGIVSFNRLETPTREAGQSPDAHYRAFMADVRGGVLRACRPRSRGGKDLRRRASRTYSPSVSSRACRSTASSMGSVRTPVKVFCWEGW